MKFTFAESGLVRDFFKDILTGKDGTSYDLGRVLGAFGFIGYMLFGTAQLMLIWLDAVYHEFPFIAFATGFGIIATATGGMIWMKKDTEPAPTPASANVETK